MIEIDWYVELKLTMREMSRGLLVWGQTDCFCQASRLAEIKSHIDYMAEFRGKYSSREEAMKLLKKMGFKAPVDAVAARFNEIPAVEADAGDIAAVPAIDGTLAIGNFIGDKVYVMTEQGMGRLPRSKALRAFEVPLWQVQSPPSLQRLSLP